MRRLKDNMKKKQNRIIVFGIPTYNEANNIKKLVKKIDEVAIELDETIVIINADNNSVDGTANIFKKINTSNEKISINTWGVGKGRNIKTIFERTLEIPDCLGCVLIDGDIESFSKEWFSAYINAIKKGFDFILPVYSRNYNEGNTTNHFIYPLLYSKMGSQSIKQGIAGDFGCSIDFIRYIVKHCIWHQYSLGYGVDIFLTLNALHENLSILEIDLDKKIHAPSFNKMYDMFLEVASSYYETSKQLKNKNKVIKAEINNLKKKQIFLNPEKPILIDQILNLRNRAEHSFSDLSFISKPSAENWLNRLVSNESKLDFYESNLLANQLLPYFIVRVCEYLSVIKEADEAKKELKKYEQIIDNLKTIK